MTDMVEEGLGDEENWMTTSFFLKSKNFPRPSFGMWEEWPSSQSMTLAESATFTIQVFLPRTCNFCFSDKT